MSELKTLKDLEFNLGFVKTTEYNEDIVDVKELKAEAVKWVKELQTFKGEFYGSFVLLIPKWIIEFFNLTDEDLK